MNEIIKNDEINSFYLMSCICLTICGIIAGICVHRFHIENRSLREIIVFAGVFAVALIIFICAILFGYSRNKLSIDMLVRIVILGGFILKLIYITYTPITVRSDDVYTVNDTGHMGYIYTLFSTYRFPTNPESGWEFPQPPLHHIIAAIWIKLFDFVGFSLEWLCESVQFLTTVYTTLTVIVVDKIYSELSDKEAGRLFTVVCATFLPYMIVMSGDTNNDALLTLLMTIIILFTLRWWKDPTCRNIIYIAVAFGMAMMTKYSVALLVPPITLVFAVRFFGDKKYLSYIKQFALFVVVCGPLCLWWPIRLKLKFDLPFGFVQASNINEPQYIGGFSIFERLFGFSNKLNHSYIVWDNSSKQCDYNIFINLIKSACFGEQDFITYNVVINIVGDILFFVMIVFTLVVIYLFIKWIIKGDNSVIVRIFLSSICIIVGMSAVIRTLTPRMAFICNSNIRFIVVAVLVYYIIAGLMINRSNKKMVYICYSFCGLLTVLSSTMWILCLMYH